MRHLTTMEKLAAISVGDIEDNLDLYMTDTDEEPVRRDIDQAVKSRFNLRNPAVAPLAGAAIGGIAGAGLGALGNAGYKYTDNVMPVLMGITGGLTGLGVGGLINAGSKASAIDEVSKKYVRRSDNARQLMMKRKEEDRAYDKEMYSKSLDLQSRGLDRAALLGGIGLAANAYASRGNNEKTASDTPPATYWERSRAMMHAYREEPEAFRASTSKGALINGLGGAAAGGVLGLLFDIATDRPGPGTAGGALVGAGLGAIAGAIKGKEKFYEDRGIQRGFISARLTPAAKERYVDQYANGALPADYRKKTANNG